MLDSARDILSKVSLVSVITATSAFDARRTCSNSSNFEASPKTFAPQIVREPGPGETGLREVCCESWLLVLCELKARLCGGALDLGDVMVRGSELSFHVFCEIGRFITSLG